MPSAHASDDKQRKNAITTNPARFFILHFQLEYERVLNDRWSTFIAPIVFHHAHWYPFAMSDDTTADGQGADFGVRYFFSGHAPTGFYAGPYLSAYHGDVTTAGVKTLDGYVFSVGAQGGYTYHLGPWVLSGAIGPSYGFATKNAPKGSPKYAQLPHRAFWANFRLNAGIAF